MYSRNIGEELLKGGICCSKCGAYPTICRWRDYASVIKVQYLCNCNKLPTYYYFKPNDTYNDYVRLWNFVYGEQH